MKVLKGIFVYTMIILGAILGVGIILIGCMYLFKMSVFGYRFMDINIKKNDFTTISLNKSYTDGSETKQFLSDSSLTINFIIDAGNYTVRVVPASANSNYVSMYTLTDFTGLVKTDKKSYNAIIKQNDVCKDGKVTISIKVVNPTGLINYNYDDNELVIIVPEKYSDKDFQYNFNISTTGGNIILKNSVTDEGKFDAPLNVQSLTASTNKGNITLGGFSSVEQEGVKVASDQATMDNLTLSTKGGTIDFTNFKKFTIKERLVLESTKADYLFDTLEVEKGIEINGSNVLIKANIIDCGGDFVYKSDTGGLDIGILNASNYEREQDGDKYNYKKSTTTTTTTTTLHNVSIFSDSANINIDAIMGKTRIENEYGKITIKNLCNQAIIKNENGDINIEKSGILPSNNNTVTKTDTSSMVLYNTYGNITVGEYYQNGLFNNKKGKITLNAKAENDYYTKVETKDGNVEFTTAGSAYNIVATDKANISIIQKAVFTSEYIKDSKIKTENKTYYAKSTNGNISIVLPTVNNNVSDGYIVNIDGKLGSSPAGTFNNIIENAYQWYYTGKPEKMNGEVISPEQIDSELKCLPLIKLVGDKTYISASV